MHERTIMTLLAASRDQGIESFHLSVRMRRATSRRNALTSSPVSAASDTCSQKSVAYILTTFTSEWRKTSTFGAKSLETFKNTLYIRPWLHVKWNVCKNVVKMLCVLLYRLRNHLQNVFIMFYYMYYIIIIIFLTLGGSILLLLFLLLK